ncbi:hypothetical protein D3C71_1616470 [compost metagenome]
MVIVTGAGKRQQPFPIGDRHRADIQLLIEHLSHFHAVLFVKALAQNAFRRGGDLKRRGRERRSVFFKHRAFI